MANAILAIKNQRGLHARAAAKFVKLVDQFDAEVTVSKDGQSVSGLSIMGLMMLAAAPGDAIAVSTEGADADTVMAALQDLIERKFEEA